MSLGERATILREQGDLAGAAELHRQEELLYRAAGDRSGVATSLGNQALVRHAAGDRAGALTLLADQSARLRELRLDPMLAVALANTATIALEAGDVRAAIAALDEHLDVALRMGDPATVATNLANQMKLRPAAGDLPGLLAATGRAEASSQPGAAACGLAVRATVALQSGQPDAAALLTQAEAAGRGSSAFALQLALGGLALISLQQGDLDSATSRFDEQLALCRAHGFPDGYAAALGNRAIVHQQRGESEQALALLSEQEAHCRAVGDGQGLVLALANKGDVTARLPGRKDEGLALLDEAARLAQSIGWPAMAGQISQLAASLR
jgi:tetratricopeptide (TPR) repeat protein